MGLSTNYFALFGLPEVFDLDSDQLSHRYRDLQRQLHPDNFVNAADKERRLSVQQASLVNDAFNTLKSPMLRGAYLLTLRGYNVNANDNNAMDPAFLMQQMELREQLGEVESAKDPLVALDQTMASIKKAIAGLLGKLAQQFTINNANAYDAALKIIQQLQFFYKLQDEAERIEAHLDEL